jgi:hypothetical protein
MKMLLSRFPEKIVQKYNKALAVDGWVYIEIRKGMYGLKQAGLLEPVTANSFGTICILTGTPHTWTMVAQNAATLFHHRSGRFRSQVRGQATRRASQKRLIANL